MTTTDKGETIIGTLTNRQNYYYLQAARAATCFTTLPHSTLTILLYRKIFHLRDNAWTEVT
jgi:hypothetical protein